MGTIDIGIGHDDDAVITQFVWVELLPTDTTTQGRYQGTDLGRRQHLVEPGLLHVQYLALQRQDSLGAPVPALLGRPTSGITLYQVEFR